MVLTAPVKVISIRKTSKLTFKRLSRLRSRSFPNIKLHQVDLNDLGGSGEGHFRT
ncbi:unnamed protein product [Acanthoscelides obtectus]|uniref:Uncharacterized protein n=1 Tax=Acanthoscelides obtectus TaxID=200917 RepID=A0A9P0QA47_ACAOB|nr:unnamed protein product [Acanthoscelides obtectus]CAK1626953.1 hypothetical protein AOBTE_LOCUS4172 [Acanthoscelides obtectus]